MIVYKPDKKDNRYNRLGLGLRVRVLKRTDKNTYRETKVEKGKDKHKDLAGRFFSLSLLFFGADEKFAVSFAEMPFYKGIEKVIDKVGTSNKDKVI